LVSASITWSWAARQNGDPGDYLADNQGDVWYGDAADNVYQVTDVTSLSSAIIQGGEGLDTLKLLGSDQHLDLSTLGNKIQSMEVIDITGTGDNTLTLNAGDVWKTRLRTCSTITGSTR
jgi:hypothetical protein